MWLPGQSLFRGDDRFSIKVLQHLEQSELLSYQLLRHETDGGLSEGFCRIAGGEPANQEKSLWTVQIGVAVEFTSVCLDKVVNLGFITADLTLHLLLKIAGSSFRVELFALFSPPGAVS